MLGMLASPADVLRADDFSLLTSDDIPIEVKPLVELTSAKATKKGKGWQIEFAGSAPKLPAGSVVTFSICWRTKRLNDFEVKLTGNRRIREKREFKDLEGFAQNVFLRAEIDFFKQPREVKEAMEKDPDTFDLERNPWSVRFYDQRFNLGTEKDLESQKVTAKNWFRDQLKGILAAEKLFSTRRKAVEGGTAFQKNGSFDAEGWQKFVEAEVREPLRAIQQTINKGKNTFLLLPHQRDLSYLQEIAAAVALRSYERSRSLYTKLGEKPDPADFSPRNIDVNCKSSKSKYLTQRTQQLCKSQGIPISDVTG